jgi:L-alanine-DL-glutamate epimerase-like enolase superfamily enzyme
VEGWSCRFPVREPFTLAGTTIHEREYLVLRVATESGFAGASYALTRGQAFDAAVLRFARTLLGLDIDEAFERLGPALDDPGADSRQGIRARSLLDIALWDIRGRAVESPIWTLLGDGGDPRAVPVMVVEGYPRVGEDDEAF